MRASPPTRGVLPAASPRAQHPFRAPTPAAHGASFALSLQGRPAAGSPPRQRAADAPSSGASRPHAHGAHSEKLRDEAKSNDDDALDPLARHAAQLAPPLVTPPPLANAPTQMNAPLPPVTVVSLEQIVPQLVRKLALAGDGKRATVRLEIGAGALAGATVVVSNEGGGIRVHVEAPAGVDCADWTNRLRGRLEAKGLAVDDVRVE